MRRIVRALAVGAGLVWLLPMAARAVTTPAVGCSWPLAIEADRANVLAPDSGAHYWFLHYTSVPSGRLVIHGTYPAARYFSFTGHDETAVALGSIHDDNIAPDPGSANPFLIAGTTGPQHYTVYIDFGAAPAHPAANTLYIGRTLEGLPNPGGLLVYRLYIPDDPSSATGDVALPSATLELAGGAVQVPFAQCDALPPKGIDAPVNQLLVTANRPAGLPDLPPPANDAAPPAGARGPEPTIVYSGAFTDVITKNLPASVQALIPHRPGVVLGNPDWRYLNLDFARKYGQILVLRAEAPSFIDAAAGELATAHKQLRFWSICNEGSMLESGLRTLGCDDDYQVVTVPDPGPPGDGFATHSSFTFVISDPAHRPSAHMQNVNWLPWGPFESDSILYRFGLPSADFGQAPQQVPIGTNPVTIMGDYFPQTAYCSTATFNSKGADGCLTGAT